MTGRALDEDIYVVLDCAVIQLDPCCQNLPMLTANNPPVNLKAAPWRLREIPKLATKHRAEKQRVVSL